MRTWLARRFLRLSIAFAKTSKWLVGSAHRALFEEEVDRCKDFERRKGDQ